MSNPLLLPAVSFILGIWLGSFKSPAAWAVFLTGLFAGAAALIYRRHRKTSFAALLCLWILLGVARAAIWQSNFEATAIAGLSDQPQPVALFGVVVEEPQLHANSRGSYFQTSTLAVKHSYQEGRWMQQRCRLRVTVMDSAHTLQYGDCLLIQASWLRAPTATNPGEFNWRKALAREQVQGIVRIGAQDTVVRIGRAKNGYSIVLSLQRRCERFIRRVFNEEQAALLRSFLLGRRSELKPSLEQAFIETGTMHLLVVSGFNVGLIVLLMEFFSRLLGLHWRLRPVFAAIAIGGYCLLTGMQPPVVRASWMAWAFLAAKAFDRDMAWPNILCFAALAMLLINPMELFDPSFQLSCGAVASLMIFTSRVQPSIERLLGWIKLNFVRKSLTLSLAASLAVALGLTPVLVWYFHLFSPIALIANVALVPLVSLLVAVGTPFILLGAFVEASSMVLPAKPIAWLLAVIVSTTGSFHKIPWGHCYLAQPPPALIAGYYLLLLVTLLREKIKLRLCSTLGLWLAALLCWSSIAFAKHLRESGLLSMYILDVGHGDSIVVQTPRRQTLVVDCGSQAAGRKQLVPFLRFKGIRSVDWLVLTHTDEDHIGGAVALLEKIPVKQLLTNGVAGETLSAKQVRRLAAVKGASHRAVHSGQRIIAGPQVQVDVLHPPAGLVPDIPGRSNDNSVVLRISMGRVSFLLTGDIEEQGLPWLLRSRQKLQSTVLKVPHHGSRLGLSGRDFFREVGAQLAVLSVGRKHHLPAKQTLEALQDAGAYLLSTRDAGVVTLKTDGKELFVKQFNNHQTFRKIPIHDR